MIIRVVVDATGAPGSCAVAKAGGDKAFEDLTCGLLTRRARFKPATDAAGKPIASFWTRRIDWRPGPPVVRGG